MNEDNAQVGGQAVIEGVMMRSPHAMAVAVRRRSGEIVVREETWNALWSRSWWARLPVFRGALILVESLMNGFRALSFAADEADLEGGRRTSGLVQVLASAQPWLAVPTPDTRNERSFQALGPLIASIVIALGLFVGVPHLLAWLVGWLTGGNWGVDSFAFHLLDGMFKLGIFVGYISLISRIPEIRRVFEYHGAEHKVVNTYERGRPLALDEVRMQGTFHARCGTSFILFVLILSIALFAAVLPFIPPVSSLPVLNHLAMVLIKVPLMAPLAGLAYELNRWAARNPGSAGVSLLVMPGRWMQGLTTREPDDDQLEVALAAMRVTLYREQRWGQLGDVGPSVVVYPNLAALEAQLDAP